MDDQLRQKIEELSARQDQILEELRKEGRPGKDFWDRLAAVAPIISGLLISTIGVVFTYAYNQQQLKLQEIQTIERFIPHLVGNEKGKKAAILAMSSLTNTELAARFAALFASEGTASALKSIAATGSMKDKKIANQALAKTYENIAERYRDQNKTHEAALAYERAIEIKERTAGADNAELVADLDELAELCRQMGKYARAEQLFKRALSIREKTLAMDHPDVLMNLQKLAEVSRLQGKLVQADELSKRAGQDTEGSAALSVKEPASLAPAPDATPVDDADLTGEGASEPADTIRGTTVGEPVGSLPSLIQ